MVLTQWRSRALVFGHSCNFVVLPVPLNNLKSALRLFIFRTNGCSQAENVCKRLTWRDLSSKCCFSQQSSVLSLAGWFHMGDTKEAVSHWLTTNKVPDTCSILIAHLSNRTLWRH